MDSSNQQNPQQQVITSTTHHFHTFSMIFVGVVMFLVGIGVGYITFSHKALAPQVTHQVAQISPTNMPITTTVVPANWQEYTNSKDGFSIKVAPGFTHSFTTSNSSEGIISLDQDNFLNGTTEGAGFHGEGLQILIYPKIGNEKFIDSGAGQVGPRAVVSTFTINGNDVKKTFDPPDGNVFIGPLIHNGYVYNFEVYGSSNESYYQNVYTMLSTFTFTN